ncbi:bacterial type II secretion system domain protein F [Aeromicrobium marinum DSM 15272]|uniref:Bacterial type II secretion system domain protein F n=1 Tax=Aeromicrobium marinum DSM 15272 TaxID=585531 RepID=E2SE74_9ACTN|nr:type II secretion system F family protein [Aeromicrobium marinum]EFQ82801.1 bacterial type II secretion system domain protein F [Aeromicrobium marinum DSM 15272]
MNGAVLGLLWGAGLCLVAAGWVRSRRPSLHDRVAPYVRDVHPVLAAGPPVGAVRAVFGPGLTSVASRLGELVGSSESVQRRLDRASGGGTLDEFRFRQLVWTAGTLAAAGSLSGLVWWERRSGAVALLAFSLIAAIGGALVCDQRLSAEVRRREQAMTEEFPAVADLLALAVAAGESPTAALQRVVARAHGELADELGRVLAEVRTGSTIVQAFDRLAARTGVTSIARFAEGLAVAVDRGTPVVDVLHAQTADVREAARRHLMETGGRREVLMMVPVVFAILPVTVVFAFYPGLVGLHLTSGS